MHFVSASTFGLSVLDASVMLSTEPTTSCCCALWEVPSMATVSNLWCVRTCVRRVREHHSGTAYVCVSTERIHKNLRTLSLLFILPPPRARPPAPWHPYLSRPFPICMVTKVWLSLEGEVHVGTATINARTCVLMPGRF